MTTFIGASTIAARRCKSPRINPSKSGSHSGPDLPDWHSGTDETAKQLQKGLTVKVKLPANQSRYIDFEGNIGWDIDDALIRSAAASLGIEWDIVIKWTRSEAKDGSHTQIRNNRTGEIRHVITIHEFIDYRFASMILWHELCHAKQAEETYRKTGDWLAYGTQYSMANKTVGYEKNKYEIEARSYERIYRDEILTYV